MGSPGEDLLGPTDQRIERRRTILGEQAAGRLLAKIGRVIRIARGEQVQAWGKGSQMRRLPSATDRAVGPVRAEKVCAGVTTRGQFPHRGLGGEDG